MRCTVLSRPARHRQRLFTISSGDFHLAESYYFTIKAETSVNDIKALADLWSILILPLEMTENEYETMSSSFVATLVTFLPTEIFHLDEGNESTLCF